MCGSHWAFSPPLFMLLTHRAVAPTNKNHSPRAPLLRFVKREYYCVCELTCASAWRCKVLLSPGQRPLGDRLFTQNVADTNHHHNSENKKTRRRDVARLFLVGLRFRQTILCDTFANGYFIEVTDDYLFDLTEVCACDEKKLLEIIDYLVKLEVFHAEFWRQKRILTSQYIQECYIMAKHKSSVNHSINEDVCLVSRAETPISRAETPVSRAETPVSREEIPQRKEKKRKEKESKEKESKEKESKEKNFLKNRERERASDFFGNEKAAWKKALIENEDWQATLVRFAGKGSAILQYVEEAMQTFDDFLLLTQREHTIQTQQEYSQNFISWWRYHNFNLDMKELSGGEAKRIVGLPYPYQPPQRLSKVDEMTETTKRAVEMAKQMLHI